MTSLRFIVWLQISLISFLCAAEQRALVGLCRSFSVPPWWWMFGLFVVWGVLRIKLQTIVCTFCVHIHFPWVSTSKWSC